MPQPIEGLHYITQNYGKTEFAQTPLGQKIYKNFGGIHCGIDFGTKGINLPVLSLCAGEVVRADWDGGWGFHVEVKGIDGWNRQYAHLSSIEVKRGEKIITGTKIGRVGNTGSSTATHLHLGNRRARRFGGWEYRDPSIDLTDVTPKAVMPTKKLIKADDPLQRAVYVFNGSRRFPIPDWDTKIVLFGEGSNDIELVSPDILSKIPVGETLISLK